MATLQACGASRKIAELATGTELAIASAGCILVLASRAGFALLAASLWTREDCISGLLRLLFLCSLIRFPDFSFLMEADSASRFLRESLRELGFRVRLFLDSSRKKY